MSRANYVGEIVRQFLHKKVTLQVGKLSRQINFARIVELFLQISIKRANLPNLRSQQ